MHETWFQSRFQTRFSQLHSSTEHFKLWCTVWHTVQKVHPFNCTQFPRGISCKKGKHWNLQVCHHWELYHCIFDDSQTRGRQYVY